MQDFEIKMDAKDFLEGMTGAKFKLGMAARRAVAKSARVVKQEAQNRTPVDTGYLKSSAKDLVRSYPSRGLTVGTVAYYAWYAMIVHEHTWYNHNVGEAKYLQNALADRASEVATIIKKEMSEVLDE